MATIWMIKNGRAKKYFAMKGAASKERRERDWEGPEKVVVKGREELCELLNEGFGEAEDVTAEEENEFL